MMQANGGHGSGAILALGDDFDIRFATQEASQPLQCQWLIINDDCPQFHDAILNGIVISAVTPPESRSSNLAAPL
jgi:hypothetical protein